MTIRKTLFEFKQRMKGNRWSNDETDLPLIAEWLLEIDERIKKLEEVQDD